MYPQGGDYHDCAYDHIHKALPGFKLTSVPSVVAVRLVLLACPIRPIL